MGYSVFGPRPGTKLHVSKPDTESGKPGRRLDREWKKASADICENKQSLAFFYLVLRMDISEFLVT